MAVQKKHGKGRLDKWYRLAKEKGYRARAAFKLIQLNKKYHVLERSKVLLDLCAAPGSWCQVASEVMPPESIIIGVDLAPIKPIPRCITFQSDITTDKCRAQIRQHLKSWKADTVLHDGAPNVGTAWIQDAFSQAELVLQSLKLATEFLVPGGTFITKVFRSKDYNSLLWVFNQLFGKVEATKPPSSRNVSAEIFVVCREYKAPKRLDSRFLDPKYVFAELQDPTPNNEARVFNPEKKKRKREGYEEGDYTQFKELPASDFIQTTDPIAMLGSVNKLTFEQQPNGEVAQAALDRMPETTEEIRNCCADLKVLGRKDFKMLLKWRLNVREKFGFATKKEEPTVGDEIAEVESMDEEMEMQEEMQRLRDRADLRKRKERRRENERKQKEVVRLQLNMTTPTDIGLDQAGPRGEDSMFQLKQINASGQNPANIARGKMHTVTQKLESLERDERSSDESDDAGDDLEEQLDAMYEQYQERRLERDAKRKAKRVRKEHDDDDFEGFSDEGVSSDEEVVEDDASQDSSDAEADEEGGPLFQQPGTAAESDGLSRRAAMFFEQDIFKNIDGLDLEQPVHDDSGIEMDEPEESEQPPSTKLSSASSVLANPVASKSEMTIRTPKSQLDHDEDFETVPTQSAETWEETSRSTEPTRNGRPNIEIITAEAMTLAHSLATGGKATREALIDDNFTRYSHRDTDGLPDWFLDDEGRHSRLQRPITAAAAAAIKEKLRAMNARPIKKVREAKARKKFKAAQRLEKLKKKSALLADDADMSEKDKARTIEKMMARAAKKKPKDKVKLVVARGANRGMKGRPRGMKGKYKMVDARLKKDIRGEKRAAKRKK